MAAHINYSGNDDSFEAIGNVIVNVNNSGLQLETERLLYVKDQGIITAPDKVKVISDQAVFTIGSFTYDLENDMGSGNSIEGTVAGEERDYHITGKSVAITESINTISDTQVTRCPRPKPEYYLKAAQVTIDNDRVRLSKVVIYIGVVPVFYLPVFSFQMNKKWDLPIIQLDYDQIKGIIFKTKTSSSLNQKTNFHTDIYIESLGSSDVGVGFGYEITDNLVERVMLSNDLKGTWKIKDDLSYNTKNISIVADGLMSLTGIEERQLGLSITRKYWEGWGGRWQLGLLGRYLSKRSTSGTEYGGIYAGYRLDYKPVDNLTLGLLRLDTYSGPSDYRDFEVYPGLNLIYDWNIPLNTNFSLNFSGVYNVMGAPIWTGGGYSDPQYWVHQDFKLSYKSCCWLVNLGWDNVAKSWTIGPALTF